MSATSSIAVLLVVFLAAGNAVPYSKYGRNCKDIGCRSDETCVMEEDPCDGSQRDSCGRYPTCRRSTGGGESCTTKLCPSGTYCRTNNGVPTCVNTNPSLENENGEKQEPSRAEGDSQMSQKPSSASSGYPSESGYPDPSQTKDKPAASSGYPSSSGYPDPNQSKPAQKPSYPVSSGYPAGSGYPTGSGYPSSSGYPGYPSAGAGYPDSRTSTSLNNAGNPAPNPYGNQAQPSGYPSQPGYNPNYPPPPIGAYNPNYPPPPQGAYNPNYPPPPQGAYNPNYPPPQGYNPPYYAPPPPTTTKKPGLRDQLTSFAKKFAQQIITQAVIDKVSGKQ